MGKVGVKTNKWKSEINTKQKDINDIKKISQKRLSATDLKPFVSIDEVIEALNRSISSFKSYSDLEASKMIQAGENKASDDRSYAGSNGFGGKITK